jgi:hypothetical protein
MKREKRRYGKGEPETLLSQLRISEEGVVGGDWTTRVSVTPVPSSYDTAQAIGRLDGQRPNRDADSLHLELPQEAAVHQIAQIPRAALGVVAKDISTAYHDGRLGLVSPAAIKRRTTWLYLVLTSVVIGLVLVFETLIGQRLWQRLVSGITADKAILASLVLTAIFAVGAIIGARILHRRYPGLIPAYGGRMILGWLVLVAITVALLAYVLGGGVQAQPSNGGISGGGSATGAPKFVAQHFQLALGLAYFLLLITATFAIIGLHLYELHHDDRIYVDANMAERERARAASTDPRRVDALYRERLKECVTAIDVANHHGRGLVGAYNAGVRSEASPDLNAIWKGIEFDDSEPTWVSDVKTEIKMAERGVRISAI